MDPKKLHLHIDLNNYYRQLNQELDSHMVALKTILKSVDDNSYLTIKEIKIGLGGTMPISPLDKEKFRQQELNKAFISIIRSLQNFIDRLVAIIDLCTKPHKVEKSINTDEDLREYLNYMEDKSIKEISADRRLIFPKKLAYFTIDASIKEILLEYSTLRNNLEHHKDVASKDTKLTLLVSTITVNGKEITILPFNVEKGDLVGHDCKMIERMILKGSTVKISESELNEIVFTLGKIISANLIKVTNQRLLTKPEA